LPARVEAAPPLAPYAEAAARPASEEPPRHRYRARFTKGGRLRFLGHLDLLRLLLRGLRRAGLPLVYSRGFNPKPRVGLGPALAVGVSSEAEYIDFEVLEPTDPRGLPEQINAAMPAGVRFLAVQEIRRDVPALGDAMRAARYRVEPGSGFDTAGALARFGARGAVRVERASKKGRVRTFDLAEEILGLEEAEGGAFRLTLALRSGGASVRPEEAIREILGDEAPGARVVREELLVDWKGRMVDPMLAASAARFHGSRAVR
jgi:radical SAM-linked protein